MSNNNTLLIVGGVAGCGCLIVAVGVAALFLFGVGSAAMRPMAPAPTAPITAPSVTNPQVGAQPVPTMATYQHASTCPRGERLVLTSFTVSYPAHWNVVRCEEMQPAPFGYVNFNHDDPSGASTGQFTLGFAVGQVSQDLFAQLSGQMLQPLGSSGAVVFDVTPFAARGQMLLRRDSYFALPADRGTLRAGQYLLRQVLIPGPGANGLTLTFVAPFQGTPQDAAIATYATVNAIVESIRF